LVDAISSWIGPAVELAEAIGMPPEAAAANARLGIAVSRGLLLDLLATQDRAAVDTAMEHWIALNAAFIEAEERNDRGEP
jgi:hypothetical protein